MRFIPLHFFSLLLISDYPSRIPAGLNPHCRMSYGCGHPVMTCRLVKKVTLFYVKAISYKLVKQNKYHHQAIVGAN